MLSSMAVPLRLTKLVSNVLVPAEPAAAVVIAAAVADTVVVAAAVIAGKPT
jgi:hypothetical protein